MTSARLTYDVVGFLEGDFGLGVAARNSIRVLSSSGRLGKKVSLTVPKPRRLHQLYLDMAREAWRTAVVLPMRSARARRRPGSRDGGRASLFHANPIEIACYHSQWREAIDPAAPAACVPFWEMPLVPRAWAPVLEAMDVLLAPTRFIERACAAAVPAGRVLHYPQAVFLPGDVRPSRERWGLSDASTVFAVSFDVGSDIERKNPLAAVEAFQRAFPATPDVELVVKMKPWPHVPQYQAQADSLKAMVGSDRRIRVVDQSLTYAQVLQLYASCDVMLSLHRSEGLGLHLMEAMTLGKVVVGTDWSGNTDFMTADNSVPIAYRLVPVATRHEHYRPEVGRVGQVWAEPDLAEADEALRLLHGFPERRRELGRIAARDMEERRQAMLGAGAFEAAEAVLAGAAAHPGRLEEAVRRTLRRE